MVCGTGDIGNYYYGQGHPMKPQRIRMCHNLLLNYGLYRKMEIYVSCQPRVYTFGALIFQLWQLMTLENSAYKITCI